MYEVKGSEHHDVFPLLTIFFLFFFVITYSTIYKILIAFSVELCNPKVVSCGFMFPEARLRGWHGCIGKGGAEEGFPSIYSNGQTYLLSVTTHV